MLDYVEIGSAPHEEDCLQLGKASLAEMRLECNRFIETIRKVLGNEPEGARLSIRNNPHDFGTYPEVVCYYDSNNERAASYAFLCESDAPATWKDKPRITQFRPVQIEFAPGIQAHRIGSLDVEIHCNTPEEALEVRNILDILSGGIVENNGMVVYCLTNYLSVDECMVEIKKKYPLAYTVQ